ncbi:M10 family metallopeptidase C-terminal domain-containing protein [Rhizobium sp. J15]|uniref:M10 family metallopeptidase C-terminal domain-containing protein n=1 Tax=Rhizobium sp. J15 TaxID=2035450 RepID=UPI001FE1FC49|nr:M10 family metallopeptidase C-terminal domain-containing protein [Rhizobium sp. J15]
MADATKPVTLSSNAVLNGLIDGGAWAGPTVTYSFAAGDMNGNGIADFDEGDWKDFYREIVSNIESFTQLTFKEVAAAGNINFKLVEGGGGESGVPGPGATTVDSIVGINSDVAGSAEAVRLGTFSLTWFHETGHALGLKHPHDVSLGPQLPGVEGPADQGTGFLNSQLNTVMGYTFPFLAEDNPFTAAVDFGTAVNAQPGSYGAIDIAALQYLYGTHAYNAGANSYTFSDDVDFNHGYTTIWDTGGVDTIEYVGESRVKIDLRAASLKAEVGGGGWISTSETLTGGYTIAHGVVIENATGGSAADILIGNGVANVLSGRDGDDVLTGGGGADRLDGGAGKDAASYANATTGVTANLANAAVNTGEAKGDVYVSIEMLTGSNYGDQLYGNAGDNVLSGRGGNDTLNGGEGADRLDGGDGKDTVSYASAAAGVTANLANAAANTGEAKGDVYISIERLTGSSHADKLYGNTGANVLTGGAGDDLLNGGSGSDALYGGLGSDDLTGGVGADTFVFKALADSTVAVAGRDSILDFSSAGGDRIDLSAIDANSLTSGDQAFLYLGTAAFTGAAGELRYLKEASGTYVYGDTNGDRQADFAIHLENGISLSKGDFLL